MQQGALSWRGKDISKLRIAEADKYFVFHYDERKYKDTAEKYW